MSQRKYEYTCTRVPRMLRNPEYLSFADQLESWLEENTAHGERFVGVVNVIGGGGERQDIAVFEEAIENN